MNSRPRSYSQSNGPSPPTHTRTHRRQRTLSVVSISPHTAAKIVIAAQSSASALGSFTLTGCARDALLEVAFPSSGDDDHGYDEPEDFSSSNDRYAFDPRTRLRSDSSCTDASVPSISRTASPFLERPPIPPGWGNYPRSRTTARMRRPPSPSYTAIHSVLEALEQDSLVGTGRVVCAACRKVGVNFPRCKTCGKMWCSRDCRTSTPHRCLPKRA
ncbi:hypothetical protein C8F01DRAFT_740607 [Mycena amicta]|nr:hypothetical protein C8F01DRAFT_740607 [Mycena amicta]